MQYINKNKKLIFSDKPMENVGLSPAGTETPAAESHEKVKSRYLLCVQKKRILKAGDQDAQY